MAKALTMPTAPEAPMAPQVSIGDRIHSIENRIEEIEGISGMNGVSKSRNASNHQSQQEETYDESEEEQEEEQPTQQSIQKQPTQQAQQRQPASRNVTTPENMARDAVANGSGALTKRTTTRAKDEADSDSGDSGTQHKNQTTVVIPPNSMLNDDGQTSFERGRAVLNEFKELDKEAQSSSANTQSSTSTPVSLTSSYGAHSEHGLVYWLFTFIAVGILAFVVVKKFFMNEKNSPNDVSNNIAAAISELNSSAFNKPYTTESAINQYKQNKPTQTKPKPAPSTPMPTTVKPVTLKTKPIEKTEDEKKGKHFEVRV